MATSGVRTFNPTTGEIALQAFARAGLKRTELTDQHMADAGFEANFVLTEFANRQPNLWTQETYTVSLVAGTATYTLPERTIDVIIALYRSTSGSTQSDTTLSALSTTDYQGLNNKTNQATPTSYWYNRQITPQITMWPVPNTASANTLVLEITTRIEDALVAGGSTMAIPYRFFDAFTAMLAAKLAVIYAPERAEALLKLGERAFGYAAVEDQEATPIRPMPQLIGYFS